MGIETLAASAVRAIGSTQSLTDPASLVKELVENAFDAGATSVHIEITSDTISKIEVRDNGHGIAPADRGLVCQRHCTSKIRNLEDLHNLGGRTFGFRGEALASALELSAKLIVSTRIESEQTGVELIFGADGLVEKERRLSHPVGATIEIDQFLSRLPVRKQLVEKTAEKGLTKIKTLLQRYAIARPSTRISFKVIRSKTTRGDWNYGPRAGNVDTISFKLLILDAAIKLFGTKAAETLRYQAYKWTLTGEIEEVAGSGLAEAINELEDDFLMECLIIDPKYLDSMPSGRFGQYISIDNRPMSCGQGVLKEISSHYKSCLRSAVERVQSCSVLDPLLVMNLRCPKGSYDINVEPAKDDVLFFDAETLLHRVRAIFNKVYGEPLVIQKEHISQKLVKTHGKFDLLLANKSSEKGAPDSERRSSLNDEHDSGHRSTSSLNGQTPTKARQICHTEPDLSLSTSPGDEDEVSFLATKNMQWKSSMNNGHDDDLELDSSSSVFSQREAESKDENEDLRDISISNPWTFAKLNRPFRTPLKRPQETSSSPSYTQLMTPQAQQSDDKATSPEASPESLEQNPCTSTPYFPYPQRAFGKISTDDKKTHSPPSASIYTQNGALDVWLQRPNVNSRQNGRDHESRFVHTPGSTPDHQSTTTQRGLSLHEIPDVSQRPRGNISSRKQQPGSASKPFISPVNDPERVWFDIDEAANSRSHRPNSQRKMIQSSPINLRETETTILQAPSNDSSPVHPDLAIALDYENRKAKATQDHRDKVRRDKAAETAKQKNDGAKQANIDFLFRQNAPKLSPNSPHKNRQMKAVAALKSDSLTERKRLRLEMLPLESVKKEYWVSDLVLPFLVNMDDIASQLQKAVDWDEFVSHGEISNELQEAEGEALARWEAQLRGLLCRRIRVVDANGNDVADNVDQIFAFDFKGGFSKISSDAC